MRIISELINGGMSRPRVSSDAAEMREMSRAHEEIQTKVMQNLCLCKLIVSEMQDIYSVKIELFEDFIYLYELNNVAL